MNFLPYRIPAKTSKFAVTDNHILEVVTDALHGLSAKFDLFSGNDFGFGKLDSDQYRDRVVEMAQTSTIYGQLKQVREYAVEGVFPEFLFNFGDTMHDVMAFTYAQLCPFNYMDEFYGVPTSGDVETLKTLLTLFFARWKLDVPPEIERQFDFVLDFGSQMDIDDERFSLNELALLARMTVRSVRNATLKTVPPSRRLHTKKDRYFVYAEREEAIRWLSQRRTFIPSTLPEGFPRSVFRSVYDKLGISTADLSPVDLIGALKRAISAR